MLRLFAKEKIITFILVVALVTTIMPTKSVMAEGEVNADTGNTTTTTITGQCGEKAYFEFSGDGVLRITGEGEIDTQTYTDLIDADIADKVIRIAMESGITSIAAEAFMGYTALEKVDFSWKTTSIREKAFADCTSLKSAIIPKTVTSIANYAFKNCTSIDTVYLLSKECIVEEYSFEGCNSIKTLLSFVTGESDNNSSFPSTWPDSLETIYSMSGDYGADYASKNNITHISETNPSYNGNNQVYKNLYVTFTDGLRVVYGEGTVSEIPWSYTGSDIVKKLVLVYGIEAIDESAYSAYSVLESVDIPETVTSIGDGAFSSCTNLKEIVLPSSLKIIGCAAFAYCSSIEEINIPDGIIEIDNSVFKDCSALTNIYIPDSVTTIDNYALWGCSALTEISTPDSVISIGDSVFYNCTALTDIHLSDNLETIGVQAFYGCESMVSLRIPNKVNSIGSGAFRKCSSLTEIEIPNNVTSLSSYTFYECGKLSKVVLPDSITSIGSYSFYNCTSLENIDLPDSLETISSYMFKGCTSLATIEIPGSVTSIETQAFKGCTGLLEVKISSGVTTIGNSAFSGCTGLTEIDIPSSVTSMGQAAFSGCTNLTTMKIRNTEVTLLSYVMPENLETICGYAESTAETYASENGITFIDLDATEDPTPEETTEDIATEEITTTEIVTSEPETTTEIVITEPETTTAYDFDFSEVILPEEDGWGEISIDENVAEDGVSYYIPSDNGIVTSVCEIKSSGADISSLEGSDCTVTDPAYGFSVDGEVTGVWVNGKQISDAENVYIYNSTIVLSLNVFYLGDNTEEVFYVTYSDAEGNYYTYPITVSKKNEETSTDENITNETTTTEDKITEETTTNYKPEETTKAQVETTTASSEQQNVVMKKAKIKKLKEKNYKSVKITWQKVEGAAFYEVYRANKKKGTYESIKVLTGTKFVDKTVKAGKKYFYKIKAVSSDSASTLSDAKKIKVKGTPNKPSIKVSKSKIAWKIEWGIIKDNSKGIEIHMKNGTGKYKKFVCINVTTKLKKSKKKKGVTGISSSINTLQSGLTYKFKARTYAMVKGRKVYSKWSKIQTLKK